MTNHATAERNQKVIKDFLALLEAKDIDQWIELWADNGVQEMPFSPPGFPTRLEGRKAIHKHYSGLPQAYGRMAFPDLVIYPMQDPNWVLAEYRGEIEVLATGRPYNNHYCGLFHLCEGRIKLFREYYNPTVLSEAFGDPSELARSFSIANAHTDSNEAEIDLG